MSMGLSTRVCTARGDGTVIALASSFGEPARIDLTIRLDSGEVTYAWDTSVEVLS